MKPILLVLLTGLPLLFTGCKNFETINTDPARSSETQPEFLLTGAQKRAADLLYGNYYNGRMGMELSQYWMGTDKTGEGRFLFTDQGLWAGLYSGPLMDLQEIDNYCKRHPSETNPHTLAIAEILKSWLFHVLTDTYIDIPYTQALQGDIYPQPVFDQSKEIYKALLEKLKQQVEILKAPGTAPVRGDVIAQGNVQQWIRIANALRIRIALRTADVLPAEAGTVIAEAAKETLTSASQDAFFPYNLTNATNRFPYNDVERPLVEFAVTSTLVDYMKSLEDPRLPVFARPDETSGQYIGKIFGEEANFPTMIGLSKPGAKAYAGDARGYLITYAEVAFALAEAAARQLPVDGTAEAWYSKGIEASMQQWGVTDAKAIALYKTKVPYQGGEWKNVIGSQKWLALYMQGLQGWFERLRLDPRKPDGSVLFIAPKSGSLDPLVTEVPSRMTYPAITRSANKANSARAAENLGGDTQAIKSWWDIH